MVIEAMVGGVDVTIIRVEGGHRRKEEDGRHNTKPSAIDTKSKGSGQRIVCRMKTQRYVNTNE
jgi:hypothetical protein